MLFPAAAASLYNGDQGSKTEHETERRKSTSRLKTSITIQELKSGVEICSSNAIIRL